MTQKVVIIQGKPRFHFSLSERELSILTFLSMRHYDGHCKSISREGGFLRGWNNRFSWHKEEGDPDPFFVHAEWHEIDTLLKVLEGRSQVLTQEGFENANTLSAQFSSMLDEANQVTPTWKKEVIV